MEQNVMSMPLSELGFIKIWAALNIEYGVSNALDRLEIEKKIFDYHGNPEFSAIFNDIIFINSNDQEAHADLFHGFNLAVISGVLSRIIDDDVQSEYLINLDINQANEILSSYDDKYVIPMIHLYNSINFNNKR